MVIRTAAEAKALDAQAMTVYGLSEAVLMENAGAAVVRLAGEDIDWRGKTVVVLCGDGNNGGDGFVAARYLDEAGADVIVVFMGTTTRMGKAASMYRKIVEKMGIPVESVRRADEAVDTLLQADVVVDALIGTGLTSEVKGEKAMLIQMVSVMKAKVVSIDVPSGINSDTGEEEGAAIQADITVALGSLKRCHVLFPGTEFCGKVKVSGIGIPEQERENGPIMLMTARDAAQLLPPRLPIAHKGMNGYIGIYAGAYGMEGAALLAAQGALCGGAGKVEILTAEGVALALPAKLPEVMVRSLGDGLWFNDELLDMAEELEPNFTALAMGCGFGRDAETLDFVEEFLQSITRPTVLDADALYAVAERKIPLETCEAPIVITPHVGEFARLTGLSADEVEAHRIDSAVDYAKAHDVVVVLKGHPTVTALPDGTAWVNTTGNPGMATGGMGDTLTGIIAALIGQGMDPEEAAPVGVFLHGLAGDMAAEKTPVGFTASDLARLVPAARARVLKEGE